MLNPRDLPYDTIRRMFQLMSLIPRPMMARLAAIIGKVWYALDRYHRDIAMSNVAIAFGREMTHRQRRQVVQRNFNQLARVALELPGLMRVTPSNIDSFAEISGEDNVRNTLAMGRGLVFLSAHFGNWELMNIATAVRFGPVHILARPLDYHPMDRVLGEIRANTGSVVIDKDGSAEIMRRLLREGRMLGILLDQNSSWYEGVFVNFFGRPACTNKGLAMFALRYDTPIVPAYNLRMPDGRYRVVFDPPLNLIRTGDVRKDILKNTALFNQTIEGFIRKAPDHWFWVHRRWRIIPVPERVRHKMLVDEDCSVDFNQ
ncbi:MAG: lysophospholipid acyltransferase family protein [Desulfatitalea sp.]|nr:lysophospholipid acyltransferase family protein [Desulfatitalea sp.]NNK00799.1 lysophospholipid acyltransferase family protein [Desulfatitalea sp.]